MDVNLRLRPRRIGIGRGTRTHLVALHHANGHATTVCGEAQKPYTPPPAGAPLCQWCRLGAEELAGLVGR